MNYEQCLRYLEKIQNLGIKFGLDNVQTVLGSFGNPHRTYPSVLVAGTNGKGSVCAMLTRILILHGFRAGLFTSPHLVKPEERIRIGDRLISRRSFSRLLTVLRKRIDELITEGQLLSPPTYFEHLTCLAFLYFQEQGVDIVLLEVGMGGRYDATNVVTPAVSVITTISAEHQKFLGESLELIAFEKAGIVKPRIPVVCGVENREAYDTIRKRAEELRAPFLGVFDKEGCFKTRKMPTGYHFTYFSERAEYTYAPSLAGEHQGKNAAMVISVCEKLGQTWTELDMRKVVQGIETTKWDGRLEIVSRWPLVVMDGAHNEEGAAAVAQYARDFMPSPIILVYAAMRGKKVDKIADALFPLAEKIIVTRFPYFRASEPEEIADMLPSYKERIVCEADTAKAYRLALENAGTSGSVLIVGSLFLVGEMKKILSQLEQKQKQDVKVKSEK
jgi:dihydrofolate synthase/folylpolyglutamate synthase